MTDYCPRPINTSNVVLPDDLQGVIEKLAENTHEVWAAQRIADGWRYGIHRDDSKKLHPCLRPFEELPDSEKEYDRRIASETLKVIMTLGYRIISR